MVLIVTQFHARLLRQVILALACHLKYVETTRKIYDKNINRVVYFYF